MMTKKLMLQFPKYETEKPIVYHLVKDFGLIINIFRAKITPEEQGYLVFDATGNAEDIEKGITFIRELGVTISESAKGIVWDEERCTGCGNCIPHCPTGALHHVNRESMQVGFNEKLCIECMSCLKNCPFGACYSVF
ncbi:MAG: 4Fe-4S binding protein [Spirochaetia bacterium]